MISKIPVLTLEKILPQLLAANDPAESHNLFDRMPERAAELKTLLGRYVDVVTASRHFDADENRYIFGEPDQGVDDE